MQNLSIEMIVLFLLPFLITCLFIKIFVNKSVVSNFLDVPNHRKKHPQNIPAFGGIVIFTSIVLTVLILDVPMPYNDMINILIGTLIIFLIGIYDDLFSMNVYFKLIWQLIACIIVLNSGYGFHDLELFPLLTNNLGISNSLINIMFMLILINGINFLDGIDGLLIGISLITLLFFIFYFINLVFTIQI